jgi:excisionase family DNA binding protein
VAVSTDQNKARKRAAKRRERAEQLRLERALAVAGAAATPPAAVSVREFAKLTGASHASVSRWIKSGELKSTKVGRRRFIAFSEIARIRGETP